MGKAFNCQHTKLLTTDTFPIYCDKLLAATATAPTTATSTATTSAAATTTAAAGLIITGGSFVALPKELLTQNRTIESTESGKAIIIETDQKKYLKSFEAGFAKDNEGFNNITDYRKNREKQNAARKFEQDQTRINEYTTDIAGVETLTREGEYVNVGKERQIR